MSRPRKKKSAGKRGRSGGRLGRICLISALVGLVGLAVCTFVVYMVVRGYLHSSKFRALVGNETSRALEAQGEFEDFQWEGRSMYTKSFAAQGSEDAFFSRLKAHEIRAKVSFAGVSRGVWEIPSVQIDKFDFVVSDDRLVAELSEAAGAAAAGDAADASSGGRRGFFARLIPSQIEIKEIRVKEMNLNVVADGTMAAGRGMSVTMTPTSAEEGWALAGRSGTLAVTGFPKFEVDEFNLRTSEERTYIDHAAMRFLDTAKVQLSGDAKLGEHQEVHLNGVLTGLELAKVLPEDWVKKFKGIVSGDFKLKTAAGPGGGLVSSGTLSLRNGSLEAMPVLQRIDTLAGTTRFRKLNFTQVEVEFEKRDGELDLGEVLFESGGLGCLKGHVVYPASGGPLGMYMLGVSPDTIKFMSIIRRQVVEQVFRTDRETAFAEVFPRAEADDIALPPEGYRWAVVRIDPDSAEPYTADIRGQFIEAGGLAICAELQGMPEKVVKAAGEVAKVAGDQGIDLIEMLAKHGFGTDSPLLSEDIMEKLGDQLDIKDLFEEGTAIPKAIIDSGVDIINDLNPLAPRGR